MTSGQREVGWYPDPSGKSGQMYWDGRQWLAGIPATFEPAAALWDSMRAYLDRARPAWDKARRFWSGLPRQRQAAFAVAALLVMVAVVTVSVTMLDYAFSGSDTSPSQQSGQSGQVSGNTGAAHTGTIGLSAQFACQGSFVRAQLPGCLNGIQDHSAGLAP